MTKLICFLVPVLLFSCTTKLLLPAEKYLDYSKSEQKIYIISALPTKSARDYSQYMSTLLVLTKSDSTIQLNAFTQFNDKEHQVISKNQFFSDSITIYNNKKFPLMIDNGGMNSEFTFALDRKYMEISFLNNETKEQNYSLIQFKKRKFLMIDSSSFINDTQVFDADLKTRNSEDSCSIFIHVIDNPSYLFAREPNSHFYLVELNLFDDKHSCMYFKETGKGDIEILYSSYTGDFSFKKDVSFQFKKDDFPIMTIDLNEKTTNEKYQIETGDLKNTENIQIGNYLIYRL
ncbi:MAG: hypothetical protein ACK46Y_16525 [Fluviicola sp.]